jgi:hypothetical protein
MAKSHFQKQKEKFTQDKGQCLPHSKKICWSARLKVSRLCGPCWGKRGRLTIAEILATQVSASSSSPLRDGFNCNRGSFLTFGLAHTRTWPRWPVGCEDELPTAMYGWWPCRTTGTHSIPPSLTGGENRNGKLLTFDPHSTTTKLHALCSPCRLYSQ